MGLNSYREIYGGILQIDGVAPSRENILNGSYPLSATYYLTVDGNERADVSQLIEYILSEEGREEIDVNFIPYSE